MRYRIRQSPKGWWHVETKKWYADWTTADICETETNAIDYVRKLMDPVIIEFLKDKK